MDAARFIEERVGLFKDFPSDPAKTNAALGQGNDPYGLMLKGERLEKILVIFFASTNPLMRSDGRRPNNLAKAGRKQPSALPQLVVA